MDLISLEQTVYATTGSEEATALILRNTDTGRPKVAKKMAEVVRRFLDKS
jgi:hypothetical protein